MLLSCKVKLTSKMTDTSNSNTNIGGSAVRFTSWNVKGLRGPVIQAKIFAHLKKFKTEIAFLQETHLITADHIKLKKTMGRTDLSFTF